MKNGLLFSILLASQTYLFASAPVTYSNNAVTFQTKISQRVQIQSVDALGRTSNIFDGFMDQGNHTVMIAANGANTAQYLYLIADGQKQLISQSNSRSIASPTPIQSALTQSSSYTSLTTYPIDVVNFTSSLFPNSASPVPILAGEDFAEYVDVSDFNGDGQNDLIFSSEFKLGYNEEFGATSTFDRTNVLGGAWGISTNSDLSQNGATLYFDKDVTGAPQVLNNIGQLAGTLRPYSVRIVAPNNSVSYSVTIPTIHRVRLLSSIPNGNRYIFTYTYIQETGSEAYTSPPLYASYTSVSPNAVGATSNPSYVGQFDRNFLVDIDYNGNIINVLGDPNVLSLFGSGSGYATCENYPSNTDPRKESDGTCFAYPEDANGLTWTDKSGTSHLIQPVSDGTPLDYSAQEMFTKIQPLTTGNGQCYLRKTSSVQPQSNYNTINGTFYSYSNVYYPGNLNGIPVDASTLGAAIKAHSNNDPFFKMTGSTGHLNISPIGSLGDVDNDGNEDFLSNDPNSSPFIFSLKPQWSTAGLTSAPVQAVGCLSTNGTDCITSSQHYNMEILGNIDGNGLQKIAMWDRTVAYSGTGFTVYEIQPPNNGIYYLKPLGTYGVANSNYPSVVTTTTFPVGGDQTQPNNTNQPLFVKNYNGKILAGIKRMYTSGADYRTSLFVFDQNWTPTNTAPINLDYDILANLVNNPDKWDVLQTNNSSSSAPLDNQGLLTLPATKNAPLNSLYTSNAKWEGTTNLGVGGLNLLVGPSVTPAIEVTIVAGNSTSSANCGLNYCGNVQLFFNLGGQLWMYQVGQLELSQLMMGQPKTFHIALNNNVIQALRKGINKTGTISTSDNLQVYLEASQTTIPVNVQTLRLVEDPAAIKANSTTNLNCTGVNSWQSGASYAAGSKVTHKTPDGTATIEYQCLPSPANAWCGSAGYEPGVQSTTFISAQSFYVWQEAWQILGTCK